MPRDTVRRSNFLWRNNFYSYFVDRLPSIIQDTPTPYDRVAMELTFAPPERGYQPFNMEFRRAYRHSPTEMGRDGELILTQHPLSDCAYQYECIMNIVSEHNKNLWEEITKLNQSPNKFEEVIDRYIRDHPSEILPPKETMDEITFLSVTALTEHGIFTDTTSGALIDRSREKDSSRVIFTGSKSLRNIIRDYRHLMETIRKHSLDLYDEVMAFNQRPDEFADLVEKYLEE